MEQPLVSVCIPAYKAERYLSDTLASVAAQTYENWELVVTEDGSRDRCEEMVQTFARSVKQPVIYTRHEKNQGLPATRNTGIASARGDWIAILDSDDVWLPNHLEACLSAGQRDGSDMAFGAIESFESESGKSLGSSIPTPEQLNALPVSLFTGALSILPSSVTLRRECFSRFGPISNLYPQVNDTEYWLRLLRAGGKISYNGAVTCRYRRHAASMSQRLAEILEDSARLCEAYADWTVIPRAIRRHRPSNLYRWAGRTLLASQPAQAKRILHRALRIDPFSLKTLALLTKATIRSRGEFA